MSRYDETTYGERIAEVYDDWQGSVAGDAAIITTLHDLAGAGPALELGIGTGRIAVPLAARGLTVHGIDASPAMVAKLREKPGGSAIPVVMGNFAEVETAGSFSLVFVVFNTFFALASQEEQLRCFEGVAAHLAPSGRFVIEAFVPDFSRFAQYQNVHAAKVESDVVRLDVARHDPVSQRVSSQHVIITSSGVRLFPVQLRYAWPSELDLMARLAGLRLAHRWGGWQREPFIASSNSHVSVYERS